MEKYTKWRDAGTGIAPFVYPVGPKQVPGILGYVSSSIVACIGLFRIAAITLLFVIWALLEIITAPFSYVSPWIHGLILRIPVLILSRFILFLLGYVWINKNVISVRKRLDKNQNPGAGSMIASNWSSYVDILYFSFKFNAVFVLSQKDESGRLHYKTVNALKMLLHCGYVPSKVSASEINNTYSHANIKNMGRINIWFFEETTTNNRALLDSKGPGPAVAKQSVYVASLRHEKPDVGFVSDTTPVPGKLNPFGSMAYACFMNCRPRNLDVRISHSIDNVPVTEASLCCARLGRWSKVRLDWHDKLDFLNASTASTAPSAKKKATSLDSYRKK